MQPLKGLTVVTLEHAIAAPFATRQLADLGARVIKIERPGVGDFARSHDQRVHGLASHFVWTNRSQESLALNLKRPRAAALLLQLIVNKADCVVHNLAPGAAARLGVSWPALKAKRRDLIVCDSSGYGDDPLAPGPYRDKKAYDLLIQSESGFVSIAGTPDAPGKAGLSIADIAAGRYAYSDILAALLQQNIDGQGRHRPQPVRSHGRMGCSVWKTRRLPMPSCATGPAFGNTNNWPRAAAGVKWPHPPAPCPRCGRRAAGAPATAASGAWTPCRPWASTATRCGPSWASAHGKLPRRVPPR